MKPTIAKLLESNNDELPSFAFPGGYPILYTNQYNDILCPECANAMLVESELEPLLWDIWEPTDWFIHYEGEPLGCLDCDKYTESAYGNPDEE